LKQMALWFKLVFKKVHRLHKGIVYVIIKPRSAVEPFTVLMGANACDIPVMERDWVSRLDVRGGLGGSGPGMRGNILGGVVLGNEGRVSPALAVKTNKIPKWSLGCTMAQSHFYPLPLPLPPPPFPLPLQNKGEG
jgi:hypothetical protein